MTTTSLKPEYVLKRVNGRFKISKCHTFLFCLKAIVFLFFGIVDLINSAVGSSAEKEKRMALEQLHSVLSVKRKGIWTKTYEALMKKHLELCVDLKDHLTAKDGLHQYRNLCQTVSSHLFKFSHIAIFNNYTTFFK